MVNLVRKLLEPGRVVAVILTALSSCLLCSCAISRPAHKSLQFAEGFSIFAEQASADDAAPRQIVEALEASTGPEFGRADVAAARRVLPDNPVWLLPSANGELCLAALDYPLVKQPGGDALPPVPSYDCSTMSNALAGKLVVTQSLETTARTVDGSERVYGAIPDGVEKVLVFFGHGRKTSTPVIRNGYEIVVDDPERIEFQVRRAGRLVTESVHLITPSLGTASPAPQDPSAP